MEIISRKLLMLIIVIELIVCTSIIKAQAGDAIPGFDKTGFDYYFDRADRELSPDRWMEEAQRGINIARSSWESLALELISEDELFRTEMKLKLWTDEEIEKRFTEWLTKRFFNSGINQLTNKAAGELGLSAMEYIYHLDSKGNIARDEITGAQLLIRPSEGRNFEEDKAAWRESAYKIGKETVSTYSASLESLFPELLAYIDKNRREYYESLLKEAMGASIQNYEKEIGYLIAREERLLTSRRLSDVLSLRKLSEEEAASAIIGRIIGETEALCNEGIVSIEARIEAAAAGTGNLALAGEEWLNAYREQFERGLKAWEDAEERFFLRRIEWEQEVGNTYLAGVEAWSNAYNEIVKEKQLWETKAKALFESGEAIFKQASKNLEEAIALAKVEFARDAALRTQAGSDRAKAWVDTYITAGTVVTASFENVKFWYGKYNRGGGGINLNSDEYIKYVQVDVNNFWLDLAKNYEKVHEYQFDILLYEDILAIAAGNKTIEEQEEIINEIITKFGYNPSSSYWNPNKNNFELIMETTRWINLFNIYRERTLEARDALVNDFGLIMGTGALVDILQEGVTSEDFNLDEYQIELIRAQAVAGYWQKRLDIANAVNEYAKDLTSNRITDTEGVMAFNEAKAAYDKALEDYMDAHKALAMAGDDIKSAQLQLAEAAEKLALLDAELDKLNREYAAIMAAYELNQNSFLLNEMAEMYKNLLAVNKRLYTDTEIYITYLEKARELGASQLAESAANSLSRIINGTDSGISLSELIKQFNEINEFGIIDDLPLNILGFNIKEWNPYYNVIASLLAEQAGKLSGANDTDKQAIKDKYGYFIMSALSAAKAWAEQQVENRMLAMGLLRAENTTDWYYSYSGKIDNEEEEENLKKYGVYKRLEEDLNEAQWDYLETLVKLEKNAFLYYIDNTAIVSDEDKLLSGFCNIGDIDGAELLTELQNLLTLLENRNTLEENEFQEKLEELNRETGLASFLMQGGSFFTVQGRNLAEALLSSEKTKVLKIQVMMNAYDDIGFGSVAVEKESINLAFNSLRDLFGDYGLDVDIGKLPRHNTLTTAIFEKEGTLEKGLPQFLLYVDELISSLPSWLGTELYDWQCSVLEYAATQAGYTGQGKPKASLELKETIKEKTETLNKVYKIFGMLETDIYGDDARAICAFLELFGNLDGNEALEEEAVLRIAKAIAEIKKSIDISDEENAKSILKTEAEKNHSYASQTILENAIEKAFKYLLITDLDYVIPGGNRAVNNLIYNNAITMAGELSREIKLLSFEQSYSAIYEAAKKEKEASNNNEHWRIYVSNNSLLSEYNKKVEDDLVYADKKITMDNQNLARGASDWLEGVLIDLTEEEERKKLKLEDIYYDYTQSSIWDIQKDLQNIVGEYINDPTKELEYGIQFKVSYDLKDAFNRAANNYISLYEIKKYYANEIGLYGSSYLLAGDRKKLEAEFNNLSAQIQEVNENYQTAAADYVKTADAFAEKGNTYDETYSEVKQKYGELEEKRFEYEKQDAIRRWASTAYLGQGNSIVENPGVSYKEPLEEIAYSQAYLERALLALNALKGLYDNGETDRLYDNSEYNTKYEEYKKSFARMLLTAKANSRTAIALANEYDNNIKLYNYYYGYFYSKGSNEYFADQASLARYYGNYTVPTEKTFSFNAAIKLDEKGNLKLLYDSGYVISYTTKDQAAELEKYFTKNIKNEAGPEYEMYSAFEEAVRDWSQRMAGYNFNAERIENWGLARDYLLRMIKSNNNYINDKLTDYGYKNADVLDKQSGAKAGYGAFGSYDTVEEILKHFRKQEMTVFDGYDKKGYAKSKIIPGLYGIQEAAWEGMSAKEKADLEFYIILSLIGGENFIGIKAISQVSAYKEYEYFESEFLPELRYFDRKTDKWYATNTTWNRYWQLSDLHNSYKDDWARIQREVNNGAYNMNYDISSFNRSYKNYIASCEKINTIRGIKEGDSFITWADIKKALEATREFTQEEIKELSVYWNEYTSATGVKHKDVASALTALSYWGESSRKDARDALDEQYRNDSVALLNNEKTYKDVYSSYMAGTATIKELEEAAKAAWGKEAAARKTHQNNLAEVYVGDLAGIINGGGENNREYVTLASEYALLVQNAYGTRFEAELKAREAEWEMQLFDINEKYKAWQEASYLILERGRSDWLSGMENFNEKSLEWLRRFEEEYKEVSNAWATAYLSSLEDKAEWVKEATYAAENALTGTMLAMVGVDAEKGARKLDTLDPISMPGLGGAEEAAAVLDNLLNMTGITGMEKAFGAMSGSAGTIASQVQRGLGGISGMNTWNSGLIQASAAEFARESNAMLAAGEAKKLAYMAKEMADEAVKSLYSSVEDANNNFRENMEDTFCAWEKSGNTYTKRIIVYSTMWRDEYERVSVEGYKDYIMAPFSLQTDLSEERLLNLSSLAIQVLIGDAQEEVKNRIEEIFGTDKENTKEGIKKRTKTIEVFKTVKVQTGIKEETRTNSNGNKYFVTVPVYEYQEQLDHREERVTGSGLYGIYIGYAPVTVASPNVNNGKDSLYVDSGEGELGRMMKDYIYYTMKEQQGWAYANRAPWEKPLWDDRNYSMNAPSLKKVIDISNQVAIIVIGAVASPYTGGTSLMAAVALSTAMNLADDATFAMLDVMGGHKSIAEAGFEFGKTAITSFASSMLTAGIGGAGLGSTFGEVIAKTVVQGTVGSVNLTMTSALNAVTYSDENGFGFDNKAFVGSMNGGLISLAGGMAGTFTNGMLGQVNLFDGTGTALSSNIFNRRNIDAFNSFAGGLVGQGVEYALGGEFTLNILNLSMLGIEDVKGNIASLGLFELNFGHDGFSMELGTGGVDISYVSIINSFGGLSDTMKITDAKISALFGNNEKLSTLDAINFLGYTSSEDNYEIGKAIWKGTLKAIYEEMGINEYGRFNSENPYEIILSSALLGISKEEAAKLAAVMAHEGTHYNGNRYEVAANMQGFATYVELINQFNLAGDAVMVQAMIDAIFDSSSYMQNTGVIDYFRKTIDGKFIADNGLNRASITEEYYDANGNIRTRIIGEEPNSSQSMAIAKYLGLTRTKELYERGETFVSYNEFVETIMDVFGLNADAVELLLTNQDEPFSNFINNATEEQQLKYYGELMLKANGYSYSAETGWQGGVSLPMSDLDILSGGYNIYKNPDGSYTSSYVQQIVNRVAESFFGKQGSTGNSPKNEQNKKGLDNTTFYQYDMYGALLDNLIINSLQTVDVYNIDGRNQLVDTYNYGLIQGNTIMSDFVFQYNYNENSTNMGTLINAYILTGHLIGADGRNTMVDPYRWLQESAQNLTSDGCFVYYPSDMQIIIDTFKQWGINQYTYIQGIMNTPYVYKRPRWWD